MVESFRVEKAPLPTEGHAVRVVVNGVPVAVFRVGDRWYGLDARCTHVGGPLDRGTVEGTHVTCPLHHSIFDLRDGRVLQGPATRPATPYRVHLDGEALVLERD
jgi:nitrite reductase/ring-hydroxylating ferredoxin subunit